MTIDFTAPETTEYVPRPWERVTLADQHLALAAMDRIIQLHPELPGAYILLAQHAPNTVDVQTQAFADLEAWRTALGVPTSEVVPGSCAPERHHLQFTTQVDGAAVRVWVMGDPIVQTQAADAVAVTL